MRAEACAPESGGVAGRTRARRRAASVNVPVPTFEGLQFSYALHPLPPGRLHLSRPGASPPLRSERWRWELWHGTTLIAAGWRLSRPQAGRALRVRAAEFGHRLFGLPVPAPDLHAAGGDLRPGAAERVTIGSVTCLLVPRALELPGAAAAGALQ